MKNILLTKLLTFFIFMNAQCSDYQTRKLYELAIKADKVVYGTIVELWQNHFIFEIEGSITGDSGKLRIEKSDARRSSYEVGQKGLLFLEHLDRYLIVMSSFSGGEFPIIEDDIYIHSGGNRFGIVRAKSSGV